MKTAEPVPTRPSPASAPTGARGGALVLALSLLLPGTGHFLLGDPGRAVCWSISYLVLAVPGAFFAFIGLSSRGAGVLPWVLTLFGLFLATCALGPTLSVLSGRVSPQGHRRPGLVGLYAALVAVLFVLELSWLLRGGLEVRRAGSSALTPVVAMGERVTVVLSRFVRPVHGDVVTFHASERERLPGDAEPGPTWLGLVLAKPGDRILARGGGLEVNGVPLELGRLDQRRELERAGRRDRRSRLFSKIVAASRRGSVPALEAPPEALDRGLDWGSSEWGPYIVPPDSVFLLPDSPVPPGASGAPPPHLSRFVQKQDIMGRVID